MKNEKRGTVIVTGCGGDIGASVGRILRQLGYWKRIVGTDTSLLHPGLAVFDDCKVLPRVSDPGYFAALEALINSEQAELLVPMSEPELRTLLDLNHLTHVGSAKVIAANVTAMKIGFDKLDTARFLKESGVPAPWTVVVGEGRPLSFPCIVKSRRGAGSVNVARVEEEFFEWFEQRRSKSDIWQEYLGPDSEEYTCGLYRSATDEVRKITFRRSLLGGMTRSGVVVRNAAIDSVLEKIAIGLDLRGSINVQLRLTSKGPVVFEINPRFSSTLKFRHDMGFEDLHWSILEAFGEPLPPCPEIPEGLLFFRTFGEFVIEPSGKIWQR